MIFQDIWNAISSFLSYIFSFCFGKFRKSYSKIQSQEDDNDLDMLESSLALFVDEESQFDSLLAIQERKHKITGTLWNGRYYDEFLRREQQEDDARLMTAEELQNLTETLREERMKRKSEKLSFSSSNAAESVLFSLD
jgi:hypothetical protein